MLNRVLSDTLLAGWLAGAKRAASSLPPPPAEPAHPLAGLLPATDLPPLPPGPPPAAPPAAAPLPEGEPIVHYPIIEEAARDLAMRQVVTPDQFRALAEDARRTAFTVARVSSLDALAKLQEALVRDVREGGTLREFREAVDNALGSSALSAAHVENVYRTNVATAYTRGLQETLQHPLVSDEFPFAETVPVHDSRLTDLCRIISHAGLDGTGIFHVDDPVWKHFAPPRHWNCRCGISPMSVEDAARRGVRAAQEWLRTGEPPATPPFVPWPDVQLPAGWAPPLEGGGEARI